METVSDNELTATVYVGTRPFGVVDPPPVISTSENIHVDLNLPAVLIWSPLVTYCDYFVHNYIVCETCCTKVHHSYWNDGSCSYKQPRLIHDVDNVVFLVSAVYTCGNGHKLLATDSRLLDKLPSKTQISFVLLHKTGFTRTLVNMVDSFCQTGMNFYSLEAAISHPRWQRFEQTRKLVWKCIKKKAMSLPPFKIRLQNTSQVMTYCGNVL